jgi:hypothetical protein
MARSGVPATIETKSDVDINSSADSVRDTEYTTRLFEQLRRYDVSADAPLRDTLLDRYRIDTSAPLAELDTQSAKAFAASDTMDTERKLYALVCPVAKPLRYGAINKLKTASVPHMVQLVAAGVVTLSVPDEERFVVFFDRPAGVRLSEFLAKNQATISPEFICERIIAPLASSIQYLSSIEVPHGCINVNNIYMHQFATLGPCVTEPCGYSQPFYYEPLERLQALPAGKGNNNIGQDYYALAVTVLYIIFGPSHFAAFSTPNALAKSILREGTYNAVTQMKNMPEVFYDFFRGMFSHNPEDRWEYPYIRNWLDGKRFHALTPAPPAEASRPFEFVGNEAHTRSELAHMLAQNWDNITEILLNGKLSQWVAASMRNKELADQITRIARTIGDLGSKNEAQLNDQLMRLLMILEPSAPFHIKSLAFHVDGQESLFAELYANKNNQELQLISHFIEFNAINDWIELQRKKPNYNMPSCVNNSVIKHDKIRPYIRAGGLGFGLERILYDLNPDMPCMSPLFQRMHVVTLSDLLKKLDALAPSLAKNQDPIDTHIAAFIASKLNINREIVLRELKPIPSLASHRIMIALYLFALAQNRTDSLRLPGLTHWLALRIIPILEPIQSRSIRLEIKSQIMDKVQTGYIQNLSQLVISGSYIASNNAGFKQAWNTYHQNEQKINNYRLSNTIEQQRIQFGHSLAKICAYFVMIVSLMLVLQGS